MIAGEKMRNRVKQLLSAVFAEITDSDQDYIKSNLSPIEQKLFYEMDTPTQKHSIKVAKSAEKIAAKSENANINLPLLIKASLLHDIGKKAKDISTADKILIVIIEYTFPKILKIYAKEGRGHGFNNICHAFYIHLIHHQRGAQLAMDNGLDMEIANLIKKHHDSIKAGDKLELKILIEADHLN